MSDRDFFVSEDGSSTATATTEVAWGHTSRTCDRCGKPWGHLRCSDSKCASMEFTERYHEPRFAGLREKFTKKPPRASVEHKAAVRAAAATVTNVLAELRSLDGQLREAVIGDVAELQPLQGLLNRVFSITGDRSLATVDGLSLSLESFCAYLDIYVKQIEDNPK